MCVPVLCTQERPLTGQTSICELFVDFAVFYTIGGDQGSVGGQGFRWWPGFPLEVRVARVSVGGHGFRLLPGFPLVARIFVYAQMSTFTSVKIPKRLQR